MRILPESTGAPTSPTVQRHRPRRGPYPEYRRCLRWDFGFTCAYCLLHEADFAAHGIEGTGLTTIEHVRTRKHRPSGEREYGNCRYACRGCNTARGIEPIKSSTGRLLDPSKSAWGDHFTVGEDELRPRTGDRDAIRTSRAYDVNSTRNRKLRIDRRRVISGALAALRGGPDTLEVIEREIDTASEPRRSDLCRVRDELIGHLGNAVEAARRFSAVPGDAPMACRCGDESARSLPAFLAAQCLDVELEGATG